MSFSVVARFNQLHVKLTGAKEARVVAQRELELVQEAVRGPRNKFKKARKKFKKAKTKRTLAKQEYEKKRKIVKRQAAKRNKAAKALSSLT